MAKRLGNRCRKIEKGTWDKVKRRDMTEIANYPKVKCPLTIVEKVGKKYEVRLSKHILQAEADCDCDLEGAIGDAFGITVQDAETFEQLDDAIRFANEVSDFMDGICEGSEKRNDKI